MTSLRRSTGFTAACAVASALAMAFTLTACTGPTQAAQPMVTASDAYPVDEPAVTITLFDGFSEGVETAGFKANQ